MSNTHTHIATTTGQKIFALCDLIQSIILQTRSQPDLPYHDYMDFIEDVLLKEIEDIIDLIVRLRSRLDLSRDHLTSVRHRALEELRDVQRVLESLLKYRNILKKPRRRSVSYQWRRATEGNTSDIAGATDATYTLTQGDVGSTLTVMVVYTDDDSQEWGKWEGVRSTSMMTVANANDAGTVMISGTPLDEDQQLTTIVVDEDGVSKNVICQWKSGGLNIIDGATTSTDTLGQTSVSATFSAMVDEYLVPCPGHEVGSGTFWAEQFESINIDLEALTKIGKSISALAPVSKRKRKSRQGKGRPSFNDAQVKEAEVVVADWEAAKAHGSTKEECEKDRGWTSGRVVKAQEFLRNRNKRTAKHAP